jgi:SAM-dependent methyltransferase
MTEVSVSSRPGTRSFASLFVISLIALFVELALIRWIPGCLKLIGYYTNLVLMASFLGLGLGCAAPAAEAGDRPSRFPFALRLLISLAVFALIQAIGTSPLPANWGEKIWGLGKLGAVPSFLLPELVFALTAWIFVPLGRGLGQALSRLRPLPGYSVNLAGSIVGVGLFSLLSALAVSPLVWFGAAGLAWLGWMALEQRSRTALAVSAVLFVVSLVAVYFPARRTIWSPYYKIELADPEKLIDLSGLTPASKQALAPVYIFVNNDYLQFAINLDPKVVSQAAREMSRPNGMLQGLSDYTQFPYRLHPFKRVLVLGSGMGNDVAAALRNGAEKVDAVEIDPAIIGLGRQLHPERPYANPKVSVHNTDARRFLKYDRGQYDVIVFAFLDSHTLFSVFSSVRLDTFVYTRQSFADAARRLAPDGVMVVLFATKRNFVGQRLFFMVQDNFPDTARAWAFEGESPKKFDLIAGGPGLTNHPQPPDPRFKDITAEYTGSPRPEIPTDDWPFLYLEGKRIGTGYALTLLAILVIAIVFTKRVAKDFTRVSLPFFLLGAGFLLLETKSITELSLLFGSTWIINAVVITAFLAMALLANLYAAKAPLPRPAWIVAALLLAILIAWLLPARALLLEGQLASALAAGGVVALPVFFAGLLFASYFKNHPHPASALGSNIIGAVAGGLLEYISLTAGFKSLYLVAAILYLGAVGLARKAFSPN